MCVCPTTPPPNPNPPNPNPTPPPTDIPFSSVYGYGLIDAGAAVARALGQNAFSEVRDLGGVNWGSDLINAPEAWNRGYTGQNIIVAVVDTGVDYTHPDLDSNIWRNNGEVFGNGVDDDRNGYIDDVIGWDFVNSDNNPMDEDTHGTHVAGTIAAENNGFGVTGVAYNGKIMPVRVLGENGGTNEWVARGIRYAADNRANVINLSLGGSYSQIVIDAVRYATQKGAIVVMAAGNESEAQPGYPASIAAEVGITVGAIDPNLYMGTFSNWAGADPDMAYVVAPGVGVYSTVPGGRYDSYDGTSMAAPHVAGVAALMLSANRNLTPTQVRQIMVETAFRGNSQQTTMSMQRSWGAAINSRRVAPGEFYGLEQQSADLQFEADWGG
jgi:subtilisin family serine protease